MALTQAAIIVIVLVACLAVTALGAAIFKHYNPNEDEGRYNTSYEQGQYMRTVRMRNYGHLRAESLNGAKDLESCYTPDGSGYYPAPSLHQQQQHQQQQQAAYIDDSHTTTPL